MVRRIMFCTPLLLLSVAVAADDAAAPAPAAQVAAVTKEQPSAAAQAKKPEKEAKADAAAKKEGAKPGDDVEMSGMSILGNDEAPKSLVIVPWKSSLLGNTPSISRLLDDSTQPVDKEVFMRELAYYQIRSNSK